MILKFSLRAHGCFFRNGGNRVASQIRNICLIKHLDYSPAVCRKYFSTSTEINKEKVLDAETRLNVYKSVFNKYIWPKGDNQQKCQVAFVISLYLTSKVIDTKLLIIFKNIVDKFSIGSEIIPQTFAAASNLLIIYGSMKILSSFLNNLASYLSSLAGLRGSKKLSIDSFESLHNSSYEFHANKQSGSVARILNRGIGGIENIIHLSSSHLAPTLFQVSLGTSVMLYKLGPQFALVGLSTITSYILFTFWLTKKRISIRKRMNKADNEVSSFAFDSLLNFEVVQYFQNRNLEVKKYSEKVLEYIKHAKLTSVTLSALSAGQVAIFTSGLTSMLMMSLKGIEGGTNTIGDFILANGLMWQIYQPLYFLGMVYRETSRSIVDLQNLFDLTNETGEHYAAEYSNSLKTLTKEDFKTNPLILKNVYYGYPGYPHLINNLSVSIKPGTSLGVVGKSGSGKSTLIKLMFKLLQPSKGNVMLGKVDSNDVELENWRKNFTIVPQDTMLFNRSIRDNIAYGREDSTEQEIKEAAQNSHLRSLINSMPEKMNSMVGERGIKISGGEKQRISIGRAILKQAPIRIYDEASSALDPITENTIMSILRKKNPDITTIFIAHRLQTVKNCDAILVVDKHGNHEYGTHTELVSNPESLYHKMWEEQNN